MGALLLLLSTLAAHAPELYSQAGGGEQEDDRGGGEHKDQDQLPRKHGQVLVALEVLQNGVGGGAGVGAGAGAGAGVQGEPHRPAGGAGAGAGAGQGVPHPSTVLGKNKHLKGSVSRDYFDKSL